MPTYKPFFATSILTEHVSYTNADAADTSKTLVTAGAEGCNINSISATNDDTSDIIIRVYVTPNGGSAALIGAVTVPAGAGSDGTTATVNILNSIDLPVLQADGSLALEASGALSFQNATQPGSGKTVDLVGYVADFA